MTGLKKSFNKRLFRMKALLILEYLFILSFI